MISLFWYNKGDYVEETSNSKSNEDSIAQSS